MREFWTDRFGARHYIYGTEPNAFLAAQAEHLQPGWTALCVGEGEGRNAVWLAQRGLHVLAVDFAPTGLEKAQALAAEKGVAVATELADLRHWDWPQERFDLVVNIFCHLHRPDQDGLHRAMWQALRPGGLLLMQMFHEAQIDRDSGGPRRLDMLYTAARLEAAFADAEILVLQETVEPLAEGAHHAGEAALVSALLRKG